MTTTPDPVGDTRGSRIASWSRLALQLLLTAIVTGFVLNRIGFTIDELTRVDTARWSPRALPLAGSVAVLLAGYAASAALWARMVVEMGGPRLSLTTSVRIYMVANLGRYVPGKIVQIAGLAWLARAEGVAAGTAVGAAVVGQAMALLGAFVVGLGAFFGTQETYRAVGWWGLGLAAVIVGATSIPSSARVLEGLWRRLAGAKGGAGESPAADLTGTARSDAGETDQSDAGETDQSDAAGTAQSDAAGTATARPGFGLRWTLAYAVNWGLYAAAFWLLFVGLEGWAPFLQVGPAFAAAYLVGYLVLFAPAGVGIRESALVVFLLPILPRDAALALAIGARLWITAVEVVPAAGLAWIQTRRGGISSGATASSAPDSGESGGPGTRSSNSNPRSRP